MALFDVFRRKPPAPPVSPAPGLTLALTPAPSFQPLPVLPANSLDAEVSRLWLQHQQSKDHTTWEGFVDALRAHNADLQSQIAAVEQRLAEFPPDSEVRP